MNEQKVTFTCATESILKHASKEVGVYLLYMPFIEDQDMHFPQLLGYLC